MLAFPLRAYSRVPKKFRVILCGTGETAFISICAWWYNLLASNMFEVRGAVVSPDRPQDALWFAANARLPIENVGSSLKAVIETVRREAHNEEIVVCITSPTPLHAQQILEAMRCGVKFIMTDKPIIEKLDEYRQIQDAAKKYGATVAISYQHRYSGPLKIRHVLQNLPKGVTISGVECFFRQKWLATDPHCPQAVWRIRARDGQCSATDIGSHAMDLVCFVTGLRIKSVRNVVFEKVGAYAQKEDFFDSASWEFTLEGGLTGKGDCHQALPGHQDDIGIVVTLSDGRKIRWQMEENPDAIFVWEDDSGEASGAATWHKYLRGDTHNVPGHKKLFDDKSPWELTSKNPPGHMEGWDNYWNRFFMACAGLFLRLMGHPICEDLPSVMKLDVPRLEQAGEQTTLWFEAIVRAHKEGREVHLNEFAEAA